ncbi:Retrovirus-related Pol polyprotein LINE-1 [Gossypium australe]|uniref:Retrovirus-related Pol polyprotein LINE-1 n=1 Tax=Gossypium australe TaxID=47621 RepID=A0A5B6WC08_9ROSI|nr:Retrovirus-related Pol polyprotein LINE-1 [Gossypium australe]
MDMGKNGVLEIEENNKEDEEIAKFRVNPKVSLHEMKLKQLYRERSRDIKNSQLEGTGFNNQNSLNEANGRGTGGPPYSKALINPSKNTVQSSIVADPSSPKANSSITEKGSNLLHPSISVLNSNLANDTAGSFGNNGILSLLQNSCTNPIFDHQDLNYNGGQVLADTSGMLMPSMSEAKTDLPNADLKSKKHTVVSFKEKGPVEDVIKIRTSGKLMGDKEGNFRATRKIIKNTYGKGNISKFRNSTKVPLSDSISKLAKSVSILKKTDSDASVSESGKADLRFIGPHYTWQRANTSERLDRALANDDWISVFPHSLVYHLPRIKSDHRPIILKTNPELNVPRGRPFCFLAGWTKHANFKDLVSKQLEIPRSTYGYIGTQKKQLLKSLGTIQKVLDQSNSRRLTNLEMEVRDELESVLNHEELLWRQKARCDWLQFGDRNTKFFHSRTIQRRKFNRILALRIGNGEWCSEQTTLREEAVKFFEDLYGEYPEPMSDILSKIFSSLKEQDIDFLNKPILNDEIKKALFDMAPLKAPRSDGFHAHFQSQWDLVGEAVCEWVQGIFAGNKIEEDLTTFLLCLFQKRIILKILANFGQSAFVQFCISW